MPNHDTPDEADLMIGPTEHGMVRILITSAKGELPMDFTPEEAEEIAAELRSAAAIAQNQG